MNKNKVRTVKVKKYAEGGLSGISSGAQQMMEEVNQMANRINYGDEAVTGSSQPVGAMAINSMKKGGSVSSASKRADGIAQRGKTRGRIV